MSQSEDPTRRAEELFAELEQAAEHVYGPEGTVQQKAAFAARFKRLNDRLMGLTTPAGLAHQHPRFLEISNGSQSKAFMIDLMPSLQSFLSTLPRGQQYTVLDVGTETGHGSNLLASMYQTTKHLGYRLHVTALDVTALYRDYVRLFCPYVTHLVQDIFTHDKTYDIVICSHTIEHVQEPLNFCRRLQELATRAAFVVAPFAENPDMLTAGHIQVFHDDFLNQLGAVRLDKVYSAAWGAFLDPPYQMFIAHLPPSRSGRS